MNRIPQPGTFLQAFSKINYIRSLQWPLIQKQERKWWSIRLSMGDYQVYVRPLEMFISPVDREKYPDVEQEYRFEQVFPGQMNELGKKLK